MARPLRIENAGAVCHPPSPGFSETSAMARGSREPVMGQCTRVSQAAIRLQRKPGRKLVRLKRLLLEAPVEYG
jgi:hypothetical protein